MVRKKDKLYDSIDKLYDGIIGMPSMDGIIEVTRRLIAIMPSYNLSFLLVHKKAIARQRFEEARRKRAEEGVPQQGEAGNLEQRGR